VIDSISVPNSVCKKTHESSFNLLRRGFHLKSKIISLYLGSKIIFFLVNEKADFFMLLFKYLNAASKKYKLVAKSFK
jgi:hypothetical protein